MGNYYIKRLVAVFFTIFLIATITFFLMRAIPGGPFTRERPVDPAILENLEKIAKYQFRYLSKKIKMEEFKNS